MKKIIFTLLGFGFFATTFAQEAFDKKMQFGIVLGTGFNMNKTSTLLDRKGVGFDQTLGLNFNYNLNSTLTITSGLEFDFESFKYTPAFEDTLMYFYKDENKIVSKGDLDTANFTQYNAFSIKERQYKTTYLIIPFFATLKTKAFGNMQYFAKFGTRIGIKTSGKINDTGDRYLKSDFSVAPEKDVENRAMILKDDIRLFKINAGISAGTMWNFSGTTMLVGEIGYFFGLTQMHYDEKSTGNDPKRDYTLISTKNQANVTSPFYKDVNYSQPSAKQGQILIKMTIFF